MKAVASVPRHPYFIVVTLSVASDGLAAESAITRRFHRARHAHVVLQSVSHVRCAIRTSTCHAQFSVAFLQACQQFSVLGAVKSVALHILVSCCLQLPQWLCSTCTVEPLFNHHVQTVQIYADRFCAMFDRAHSGSVILRLRRASIWVLKEPQRQPWRLEGTNLSFVRGGAMSRRGRHYSAVPNHYEPTTVAVYVHWKR